MAANLTPGYSYMFSNDFDYRHYLEEKSHFDRVELNVDSGIRKLIASNEEIARLGMQANFDTNRAIAAVGEKIDAGFDRLSISIDTVRNSIDDLRFCCEYGFGQLSLGLNSINLSINRLIEVTENPERTWELEQYRRAQDAFNRNLFEESLVYISRAIDGHGERSGNRLEHRFHMLKGLIRLGSYRNSSEQIVDLDAAEADFLAAAKYAEHIDNSDRARSFGLAGWAAYCRGDMAASEGYLSKSLELNPLDLTSQFDLTKVLFHTSKHSSAMERFASLIRSDFHYGLRAAADPDFLANRDRVVEVIDSYRADLQGDLRKRATTYEALLDGKSRILQKRGVDLSAKANFFDPLARKVDTAAVSELLKLRELATASIASLNLGVAKCKENLQREIAQIKNRPTQDFLSSEGSLEFLIPLLAIVGGVIGAWIGATLYIDGVHNAGKVIFDNGRYSGEGFIEGVLIRALRPVFVLIIGLLSAIVGSIGIGLLAKFAIIPMLKVPKNLKADSDVKDELEGLELELKLLQG